MFLDARTEFVIVDERFFRTVRKADAAAEVEEFDIDTQHVLYFDSQFKHHLGRVDQAVDVEFVGDDHGVQAEVFDAFILEDAEGVDDLFAGHAVFGFFRRTDDVVAAFESGPGL